ncbi:hypothetical protein PGT21_021065 [Puccinia graminis f. sp. tritici]|uniref:Uncharacterized protein n=1 Tax=Puccinia graminis f. sp. tritici TaxID=56615 RepID=A0A5B0M0Q3_PUCGR|nr:hypothetical protein PGT21_021065 [Puccinia graminis f. sp. tritici]KAA1125778.1 hypothetical protein PGTUg99_019307 [Puccinia graminis f. sp. tritici]
MAKLTDLPAELVHRIIGYILQPKNDPIYIGAREAWDGRLIDPDDHHLLDHNAVTGIKPKLRPHHELQARALNPPRTAAQRNQQATPLAASRSHVSWPHGLPSNPLLPLSLVCRTFQKSAQERLFRNVPLLSQRRARLFLQTLTRPDDQSAHISGGADIDSPDAQADGQEDEAEQSRSSRIDRPRLSRLAQHVRTLQLMCVGPCLMGGGGLLCEIIGSCPLLENVAISTTFSIDCREPLLDALATRRQIKEFVVIDSNYNYGGDRSSFRWSLADLMSRLLPHWDLLETLDVVELVGGCLETNSRPGSVQQPIPILNCPLRTLILHQPEIDEKELSMLLKSFRESLRTLEIIGPAYRIGRAAINRVLKESASPQLESLSLDWSHYEQPIEPLPDGIESDDPDTSPGLLDLLFKSPTALRNLKSLSFVGSVATHRLFERLSDSLVKLARENCEICPSQFVRILSSTRKNNMKVLPNLRCCSVRSRYGWDQESEEALQGAMEARGACFHMALDPDYGEPTSEDELLEAAEELDLYFRSLTRPLESPPTGPAERGSPAGSLSHREAYG